MIRDRRLLRLFFINWTVGVLLGMVFAAGLLWFDLGGLASLLGRSDMKIAGMALLFGGFAVTFGGVVCGSAVMFQAGRDDEGPGNGLGAPVLAEIRIAEQTGR